MSRSGYIDDFDGWELIQWRAAVASAIKGRRGQAFLKEMLRALDGLPEPKLIACELQEVDGAVCAIGAVGRARGIDMAEIDPEDREVVAGTFGIAMAMAAEIVFMNDECCYRETPEARFVRMRSWIEAEIVPESEAADTQVGGE